jgi:hypothetical protein
MASKGWQSVRRQFEKIDDVAKRHSAFGTKECTASYLALPMSQMVSI